ncbi:hypothetical protein Tco_0248086 [Tanacetum coccineum]
MLTAPQTSLSRITSSPGPSPSTSQLQNTQPTPTTEEPVPSPHESPLQSVHSLGRDEGSLSLNELTVLCTNLSKKIEGLESELKQTKQTYNFALTKLIKRVKKLEQTIKTSKVKRRAKIVLSEDEDFQEDAEVQEKLNDDTEVLLQEEEPTELVEDQGSREKGEREVSTGLPISTADLPISTATITPDVSTASEIENQKDDKIQMTIDEELDKKVFVEEQERFNAEQEARAKEEQEQEKQSDTIKRYQTLRKKLVSVAQARKNMMICLRNMADTNIISKESYDKGQKVLEESAEKTETEQVKIESSKKDGGTRKKSLARKRARETLSEENAKKQKLKDDDEKEELQGYMSIVSEDEGLNVESLATKYPIIDWETQILGDKYYYHIKRADGSVKHYNLFSVMLYDFDRQDIMIKPNAEDEIWRNQEDWNLISWKLHDFCGVHVILMSTRLVIHMMVERKYPLSQDILSKMLSRRLEVDHQSEMSYELIRGGLLGINLHKIVLLVQEVSTARRT